MKEMKTKKPPIGSQTEPAFAKLTVAMDRKGGKFRHISPLLVRSFKKMERTGSDEAQCDFVSALEPLTGRGCEERKIRAAASAVMRSIMREIGDEAIRRSKCLSDIQW
jgi:hypothetical protein